MFPHVYTRLKVNTSKTYIIIVVTNHNYFVYASNFSLVENYMTLGKSDPTQYNILNGLKTKHVTRYYHVDLVNLDPMVGSSQTSTHEDIFFFIRPTHHSKQVNVLKRANELY
jgi:hypothetical protein